MRNVAGKRGEIPVIILGFGRGPIIKEKGVGTHYAPGVKEPKGYDYRLLYPTRRSSASKKHVTQYLHHDAYATSIRLRTSLLSLPRLKNATLVPFSFAIESTVN